MLCLVPHNLLEVLEGDGFEEEVGGGLVGLVVVRFLGYGGGGGGGRG